MYLQYTIEKRYLLQTSQPGDTLHLTTLRKKAQRVEVDILRMAKLKVEKNGPG